MLSIAAFASIVKTIGRLSNIHASPKSAKIFGGIGLPPIVNDLRTLSSGSAANAVATAGRAYSFEARGDVDAVAHQIAVGLLDHVAQMDADAKYDVPILRQAGIAFDRAVLHFDRAAHRPDHATKLDENAVAGALDGAPMMRGDRGVDQVAAQPTQTRQSADGRPAIARGELGTIRWLTRPVPWFRACQ